MSEYYLVRDDGFHAFDEAADGNGPTLLAPDTDPATLSDHLDAPVIAIDFPSFGDGRGFTLARLLREKGYVGHLRAVGGLIADQYAMARRVGFDEVRISAALAARQPQEQWLYRADWREWDQRARLAG